MFEDNEAVIRVIVNGRRSSLRTVSGTHRVHLDWLFERVNLTLQIPSVMFAQQNNSLRCWPKVRSWTSSIFNPSFCHVERVQLPPQLGSWPWDEKSEESPHAVELRVWNTITFVRNTKNQTSTASGSKFAKILTAGKNIMQKYQAYNVAWDLWNVVSHCTKLMSRILWLRYLVLNKTPWTELRESSTNKCEQNTFSHCM